MSWQWRSWRSAVKEVVSMFSYFVATLGLEVRFKSSDFFLSLFYGEHDHWRSGSQGRSASFCNSVLRKDWPAAQNSAHRRAAPVRTRCFELFGGHRCGQARWVPNG